MCHPQRLHAIQGVIKIRVANYIPDYTISPLLATQEVSVFAKLFSVYHHMYNTSRVARHACMHIRMYVYAYNYIVCWALAEHTEGSAFFH